MNFFQNTVVLTVGVICLIGAVRGFYETYIKNNSFGIPWKVYYLISCYVWADVVIMGSFWALISLFTLFLNNWVFFLLTYSVFWLVRSFGETIYWLNQQFSTINRNPPEQYLIYKIFKNDSVWFIYQVLNQCIMVVSLIATLYFAKLWLL